MEATIGNLGGMQRHCLSSQGSSYEKESSELNQARNIKGN